MKLSSHNVRVLVWIAVISGASFIALHKLTGRLK